MVLDSGLLFWGHPVFKVESVAKVTDLWVGDIVNSVFRNELSIKMRHCSNSCTVCNLPPIHLII